MVKLPSRPTILAASLAGILTALPVQAADTTGNPPAEVTESSNIEALTVTGKRSADQKGADDVFYKNVSNAYLGKEYLERYQTDAAGDVLKGLNGVYNMNTRNAGSAITPSIRGISGKGRIPVTIDGTEQTVDVWMNNYGIADRNYVDPALFRSIAVEKSPAMTRGVKSGVGGSVAISTIEADDIVPEATNGGFKSKAAFPTIPPNRAWTICNIWVWKTIEPFPAARLRMVRAGRWQERGKFIKVWNLTTTLLRVVAATNFPISKATNRA